MTDKLNDISDLDFAKLVIESELKALEKLHFTLDERFVQALNVMLTLKGAVMVSGVGKSGLIGQKISATFASTGTSSHFIHPTEAMHGDIGRLNQKDLLLLLSYSGETDEVLALAAITQQDKIPIISITGFENSHLAQLSDVHLTLGNLIEACPHNLAPTASTTSMLALGDAMALTLSRRRAFSAEDFRKLHPGGALGRQMMQIAEALRFRVDENLSLLSDQLSVEEVLQHSSTQTRRAGAVLLVNSHGTLSGIFTDGDLRRLLTARGSSVMTLGINEVMTPTPKTLRSTQLLRDAVQMIRETRLDEIPVVDEADRPVGLLDVQDLIALKLIEG